MKKIVLLILMPFVSVLLTSCSLLSSVKVEQNNYVINTVPFVNKSSSHPVNLLVSSIEASPVYNTNQMAYTTKPYEVKYYSKNVWAETPPQMLQPLIIQTLHDTDYFHSVNSYPSIGNYDYLLNVQILELLQKFSGNTSYISLKIRVQIIDAKTSRVMGSKELSVNEPAVQNTPYGGVVAANRATSRMLAELARFCVQVVK